MEHYVTLFDSLFLPQGLALLASLKRHGGPFRLWVLCLDEDCFRLLSELKDSDVQPIALADIETPALLKAKAARSRAEYCWTLTPFAPGAVFSRAPELSRVTYVDADTQLLGSPAPLFAELEQSGKAVMITDHGYAADADASKVSGKYCVQFITFYRQGGEPVRQWWEERCLEWCYARVEDGKFGDQRYLESFPELFPERVHILQAEAFLLGPWNVWRFPLGKALFYHYHGARLLPGGAIFLGYNPIPETVRRHIYGPYRRDIGVALQTLARLGWQAPPQLTYTKVLLSLLRSKLTRLVKRLLRPLDRFIVS